MAKPQSPELRRSGRTPGLDPDNVGTRLGAASAPTTRGRSGPVPADNQPGHHPDADQDRPDPREFARHTHELAEQRAAELAQEEDGDGATGAGDEAGGDGGAEGQAGGSGAPPRGRVVDLEERRHHHTGARAAGVVVGAGALPLKIVRRTLGRSLRAVADLVDPRPRR